MSNRHKEIHWCIQWSVKPQKLQKFSAFWFNVLSSHKSECFSSICSIDLISREVFGFDSLYMFRIWSYSAYESISRITNYSYFCSHYVQTYHEHMLYTYLYLYRLPGYKHNSLQMFSPPTQLRFKNRFILFAILKEAVDKKTIGAQNEWNSGKRMVCHKFYSTSQQKCGDPSAQPTTSNLTSVFLKRWIIQWQNMD